MMPTMKIRGSGSIATKAMIIIGVMAIVASNLGSMVSARPIKGSHTEGRRYAQEQKHDDKKISIHQIEQQEEDSILSCTATPELPDMNEISSASSREEFEIEANVAEYPSVSPSMIAFPSESPSVSMPCSDPFSNPRGFYTTTKAPCVIRFHNENESEQLNELGSNRKRYHGFNHKDDPMYIHGTSSICETENKIGEAKEYLTNWPDECVGDFARCYDLTDPNQVMCGSLRKVLEGLRYRRLEETSNTMDQVDTPYGPGDFMRSLQDGLVPPGTTHISIDCTIDREVSLQSFERSERRYHDKIQEAIMAAKERTLFVVFSILAAVLIVVYAISMLVVQPIVGVMREAYGNGGFGAATQGARGNNQGFSLVTRTNGFQIESQDHSCEGHEVLPPDEIETATTDSMTLSQEQQTTPFDFDAVPIVPATIIELDAIQAEIIQDGASYYA